MLMMLMMIHSSDPKIKFVHTPDMMMMMMMITVI